MVYATIHSNTNEIPQEIVDYWDRCLQKEEVPEYFFGQLDYIIVWLYATQKYSFSIQDMKSMGFNTGVLLSDKIPDTHINYFDTTRISKNKSNIFTCFDKVIEINAKAIQLTIS